MLAIVGGDARLEGMINELNQRQTGWIAYMDAMIAQDIISRRPFTLTRPFDRPRCFVDRTGNARYRAPGTR